MPYSIANKRELLWATTKVKLDSNPKISEAFVQELERVFLDPELFDASRFDAFELAEVFTYLKSSHETYLYAQLPKIENTLNQLCSKFRMQYISLGLLRLFIDRYKRELEEHILLEERLLFSFVTDMLAGSYSPRRKRQVLTHFLHTHNDNVVLALNELKSDLILLDDDLNDNMVFSILFEQLSSFQTDLMVHGLIEDNVFVPKIVAYADKHFPDQR